MNSREADEVAALLTGYLAAGDCASAYGALKPVLEQRTPFRLLDRITAAAGPGPQPETGLLLDQIAEDGREGGWVVIGGMLWAQYASRPAQTLAECRRYIVIADTWYGADILGERGPGPALVEDFERAQVLLSPWREDANHWVRRSIGVAVHFWAKRSRGDEVLEGQAQSLLAFLEPMFGEWEMDAVKGVGWGLKTMGKYYPLPLAGWLLDQRDRKHRRLMLRKAMTYLPGEDRRKVLEAYGL